MSTESLPSLALEEWRPTRDTIHNYARLLGKIRAALTPPQKHWWHITLHVTATGLSTTPIPVSDRTFELLLDLVNHKLVAVTSDGAHWTLPLHGQSIASFCQETLAALSGMGINIDIDRNPFGDESSGTYDREAIVRIWRAVSQIDTVLKRFKGTLREETSPVQIFPHHFDLSVNWFSGQLVPGEDPADEESADAQMNFGFSTGDEGIAEPYFYITAYPQPAGLMDTKLPPPAVWLTESFSGAVLKYADLRQTSNPQDQLFGFFTTVQRAGSRLMRNR